MPSSLSLPHHRLEEEERQPPSWTPAPERPHRFGLLHEATDDDWERAEVFCKTHLPSPPRILPSDLIDRIRLLGCAAWGLERPITTRFVGRIQKGGQDKPSNNGGGTWKVCTRKSCQDTCVMSDLPLMAGLYDIHGRRGIYYEVRVNRMEGVVAIGTFHTALHYNIAGC
jgi:Ran-binding protein 9/10